MSNDETPDVRPLEDWRKFYAFGLPSGSIRALLALAIFGITWTTLALRPNQDVPDYLRDLLFIIMGHYFASRHKTVRAAETGPPPLFLPNGSVRILLVAGSIAVGAILFRDGTLTNPADNPGVITLLMVGGFLLGVVVNWLYSLWKSQGHRSPRIVEDLRAGLTMIAAALLIVLVANRLFQFYPQSEVEAFFGRWIHFGRYGIENILAAIVGFYFGSRS